MSFKPCSGGVQTSVDQHQLRESFWRKSTPSLPQKPDVANHVETDSTTSGYVAYSTRAAEQSRKQERKQERTPEAENDQSSSSGTVRSTVHGAQPTHQSKTTTWQVCDTCSDPEESGDPQRATTSTTISATESERKVLGAPQIGQ